MLFHVKDRRIIIFNKSYLLTISLFIIFFIPLFDSESQPLVYQFAFSALFLGCVLALEGDRKPVITLSSSALIMVWLADVYDASVLSSIGKVINILLFFYVTIKIVIEISRSEKADASVIIDALTGYFLLGLTSAMLVLLVNMYNPASFSMNHGDVLMTNCIYFSFVTFTTLGYGDILPVTAGAKSISMLIVLIGQVYLATLMALLISKIRF